MGNEELLSNFTDEVAEFAKYRSFVERAEAQAGKFREQVVQKVVKDNADKALEVVERIIPLVVDVEEVIDSLRSEKAQLTEQREGENIVLQELELRLAIEELTQEQFDEESADHKSQIESIDEKSTAVEKELGDFGVVMDEWKVLGVKAGILVEEE